MHLYQFHLATISNENSVFWLVWELWKEWRFRICLWENSHTVKLGSSLWPIVCNCHSGCRWVNQLHTWIRIITWLFIIKEHVTLIPLHIWCVLFTPLLLMYSVIICVQVCNWFTHLQPEWQTRHYIIAIITMNDNLSFLLKEWTKHNKCAVESK